MKLRNNKTGEVKAVNHAKILVHFSDGTTDAFNSLKELTDKYSDYTEPLIKDEKIRKAVRAWAEANGYSLVKIGYDMASEPNEGLLQIHFEDAGIVDDDKFGVHSIAELCGYDE